MAKRKVKPTKLQRKTLQILRENPDMPLGKAMRKAGYKPSTSQAPSRNFLDLKGTQVGIEQWRKALREAGLDEALLIRKYKEWIDAVKIKSDVHINGAFLKEGEKPTILLVTTYGNIQVREDS